MASVGYSWRQRLAFEPPPVTPSFSSYFTGTNAWRQFLIGQPVEGQVVGGGRVDPTAGTRPGDMGNIDYGPDSTGQWSGQTRTEDPADALASLGGSGLSIADAQQDNESDSESESEDESTGSESDGS